MVKELIRSPGFRSNTQKSYTQKTSPNRFISLGDKDNDSKEYKLANSNNISIENQNI